MLPHDCSGLPLTMPGLNLHRLSPALAASSRRREPDERSTLLSSTLPFTSIRTLKRTVPVSFARRAAAGYGGSSHNLAWNTGGVRTSGGLFVTAVIVGAITTGTCTVTSGGGIYGGGGVVSLGGGGGGGLSGGGALISSMIFVSRGARTTSTILRARPWTRAETSTTWDAATATHPASRLLAASCN